MFKKGSTITIAVKENGDVSHHYNCLVLQYEDGLLKVRQGAGKEVVYNVHSPNFVLAEIQD